MRIAVLAMWLLAAVPPVGAQGIWVEITSPERGQALFGEITIAASVEGDEPIRRVEFWINGVLVAARATPPYQVQFDVGEYNIERTISAVAEGASGRRVTATLVFPPIVIDLAVELNLQQLYVTVTRDGEPVLDLDGGEFSVFDNGVRQELVTFEQGDVPMTIAFLIDASSSMSGESFSAAIAAARGFLARLGPLDESLVMVFSDRTLSVSDFASGPQQLPREFDRILPAGGTAINDHLYAALRLLDGRQGKPVVLLLSDGADTVSLLRMNEVRWKIRRSNALIYRLQVARSALQGAAFSTVWRTIAGNRAESDGLRTAIDATGGRVRAVARISQLGEALEGVLQELRQQYALGYYPSGPQQPGVWRPIQVGLESPALTVRTRDGYVSR